MYLSATELMDTIDATELGKLATPGGVRAIPGAKMAAVIAGTLSPLDPEYSSAVAALSRVNQTLAERSSYVDGFLSLYSPLPVPDAYVPAVIKSIMVALVRWDLAKDAPSETIRDRYLDARKDLQAIADGSILLNLPGASGSAQASGVLTSGDACPIYTMRSTRSYQDPWGTRR